MKQFAAAILTLWLAVDVLGIPAPEMEEPRTTRRPSLPSSGEPEVYVENDIFACCYYKPQDFNCENMKYYFNKNSGCPYQGILFVTKKDKNFCANPDEKKVQECIKTMGTSYLWHPSIKYGQPTIG